MTLIVTKTAVPLVKQAHEFVRQHLKSGDVAVDATVGNGHDTLFLLSLVKPNGRIFGFDIQQTAIAATQALINHLPNAENATLICTNHSHMGNYIPAAYHGKISAVMFNLGYLPGGNKQIITQADSTIAAITSAVTLLAPGGIVSILAYPGHAGGLEEAAQVQKWCVNLNHERFQYQLINSATDNASAPLLHVIIKSHSLGY